ncbi:MAG: HAD family hydrolase [Sphingorhabdus sp.]
MRNLSIYDLDRTITIRPTYTPFLLFAARRLQPWRLMFLPIWLAAMVGYKAGLYRRVSLKEFGMRLFVGTRVDIVKMAEITNAFVVRTVNHNIAPGAKKAIQADLEKGSMLLMATAASELYAGGIAKALGFDDCLSTRQVRDANGDAIFRILGENNYGAEKLRRIDTWILEQGLQREELRVTAYSDHASDAPLLNWADKAVLVGNYNAPVRNWETANWR